MSYGVTLDIYNGIADVRMNRPESMNAIGEDIMNGMHEVLARLRESDDVRVVVLSGNGKGFCSGLDFANFGDMMSGDLTGDSVAGAYDDLSPAGANYAQQLGWGWQELPMPVIAAVHGAAMGAGINIALGADIRIVHPDTKMGFVEVTYGLLPDMSATLSLQRLASLDRIKELVLTGRRFNGSDAKEYGLATELSETPLEDALEMAAMMASRSPDALRRGKQLLNQAAELSARDMLIAESNCSREMLGTPNQLEAVMATFEKREPNFG